MDAVHLEGGALLSGKQERGMDFEGLHDDDDGLDDPLLLGMEKEMGLVNLNNQSSLEYNLTAFETIKELGVLQTIQDIKNPECYRFHLFTPILSEAQEFIFLRALKANSPRLSWASFEAVNNLLYLEVLSCNLKYLKINVVESPLVLKSLTKAFENGGNLANLNGLSLGFNQDCFPVTYFLDSISNLDRLLLLRLTGEFREADVKKISKIVRTNHSLLYLGLHNLDDESQSIYDVLLAICDHNGLRTLDLKGTKTSGDFLKELNDCLRNNHSLSQLIVDDSESLVSSLIGGACRDSLFLQALEVAPDENDRVRSIYKNTSIIDSLYSEDEVIGQYCRENMKKQILSDILVKNSVKLSINLKIFSPTIPTHILARIMRLLFPFFSVVHFSAVSKVMLDRSRQKIVKSPYPFSAVEFLRRCYCLLPENIERDYDFELVVKEMQNLSSPDYLHTKTRDGLQDGKKEIYYF